MPALIAFIPLLTANLDQSPRTFAFSYIPSTDKRITRKVPEGYETFRHFEFDVPGFEKILQDLKEVRYTDRMSRRELEEQVLMNLPTPEGNPEPTRLFFTRADSRDKTSRPVYANWGGKKTGDLPQSGYGTYSFLESPYSGFLGMQFWTAYASGTKKMTIRFDCASGIGLVWREIPRNRHE